jgi:hypothetical protein
MTIPSTIPNCPLEPLRVHLGITVREIQDETGLTRSQIDTACKVRSSDFRKPEHREIVFAAMRTIHEARENELRRALSHAAKGNAS